MFGGDDEAIKDDAAEIWEWGAWLNKHHSNYDWLILDLREE